MTPTLLLKGKRKGREKGCKGQYVPQESVEEVVGTGRRVYTTESGAKV